jgi:D-glycero-alpha-D-manno-heptose-7-phosphate kinase
MDVKGTQLEIPLSIMKEFGQNLSIDLFLASEILPGTGLGSSASVCVGVLRTLSEYLGVPLSKYQLAERAFNIARHVLGKPVGKQDEYAAAFGGLNFINFEIDGSVHVEPVVLRPDHQSELQSNLLLFFTGSARSSWKILQEQERSTSKGSGSTLDSMHEIRALAEEMRETLLHGDLRKFGALLHAGWEAKKKVSQQISNPMIDEAYGLARQNGALGGKITGAGGGGFLLLYCEEKSQASVREAMSKLGIHEMAFEFDTHGARVVANDPFIDEDARGGMRWTFEATSSS